MSNETSVVRTIGRYHIQGELGRGAMGVVYKAFDPVIGRTVALKTMAFAVADGETRELRDRLRREASAAGTLNHPNIVTVYDVVEEGGVTAVAIEYVEGRTLASVIADRGPLPIDEAIGILEQVCQALDYANAHGVIHRDIKPSNILMTSSGQAKVADFGVARMATSHQTQTGVVVGSPSYMSPEQVKGQPLDGRSDLFSAAVVFYEMVTKERPFGGNEMATTMYRIVHEPPTPAYQFNAAVTPTIAQALECALAKDPDERYRSGADTVNALRQAMSLGGVAVPAALPSQAPRRRLRLVIGVTGFVLVGLVGLILARGMRSQAPPIPQSKASQAATSSPPVVQPSPIPESAPAAALAPVSPAAVSGPVSTIPPPTGSGASAVTRAPAVRANAAERHRPGPVSVADRTPSVTSPVAQPPQASAPAVPPVAEPAQPSAAPPAEPARSAPAPASVGVAYKDAPFPVELFADGRRLGRITRAGANLDVPSGEVQLRAVGESVFLDRELGNYTLAAGEARVLTLPGMSSAFVEVRGNEYDGVRILIDDRVLAEPYPAQIPRIVAGPHGVTFRWALGRYAGLEVTETLSLEAGGHYLVRAVPENRQIVVQKLR